MSFGKREVWCRFEYPERIPTKQLIIEKGIKEGRGCGIMDGNRIGFCRGWADEGIQETTEKRYGVEDLLSNEAEND